MRTTKRAAHLFSRPLALAALALSCTALVTPASSAADSPSVRVYDVRITGVLRTRFTLQDKPFGVIWREVATWTETYTGVRLNLQTFTVQVLPENRTEELIHMKISSPGKITGSIKYTNASRKQCGWQTTAPDPGRLSLTGTPVDEAVFGPARYQLVLYSGPSVNPQRPQLYNCTYYGNPRDADFVGVQIGGDGAIGTGAVDTRSVLLRLEFRTSQGGGKLSFPLDRLYAGKGFVLELKGLTKKPFGAFVSEGTARIAFVPRST
jgi:hypothetical protein